MSGKMLKRSPLEPLLYMGGPGSSTLGPLGAAVSQAAQLFWQSRHSIGVVGGRRLASSPLSQA